MKSKFLDSELFLSLGIICFLDSILEIEGPVRMFLIGSPAIPRFRSFGHTPMASSEGFLGSFTPGWRWKSSIMNFYFLLEYSCNRVIQIRQKQEETPAGPRNREDHAHQARIPALYQKESVFTYSERPSVLLIVPMGSFLCTCLTRRLERGVPREVVFRDMMTTTNSRGILGPLNPTDEALKEGRNNQKGRNRLLCFGTNRFVLKIQSFVAKKTTKCLITEESPMTTQTITLIPSGPWFLLRRNREHSFVSRNNVIT